MLSHSPLVPSKAALRVLYHLAFAGSAITAVGVVSLNCHVYRQFSMLEQNRERKRQLRPLSNGTGRVSMARLIEAAELGQDISVHAVRAQASKRRHSQSSGSDNQLPSTPELQVNEMGAMLRPSTRSRTCTMRRNTTTTVSSLPYIHEDTECFAIASTNWPKIGSMEEGREWKETHGVTKSRAEEQPLKPAIQQAPAGRPCGNREQAAERIKHATKAMTSLTPSHVCGRPNNKALPNIRRKTRPQIHAAVTSWLGAGKDGKGATKPIHSSIGSSSVELFAQIASQQDCACSASRLDNAELVAKDIGGNDGPPRAEDVANPCHSAAPSCLPQPRTIVQSPPRPAHADFRRGNSSLQKKVPSKIDQRAQADDPGQATTIASRAVDSLEPLAEAPSQAVTVEAEIRSNRATLIDDQSGRTLRDAGSVGTPVTQVQASSASTAQDIDAVSQSQPHSCTHSISVAGDSSFPTWPHLPSLDESDYSAGSENVVQVLDEQLGESPLEGSLRDGRFGIENKDEEELEKALQWSPSPGSSQSRGRGSLRELHIPPVDLQEKDLNSAPLLDALLKDFSKVRVLSLEEKARLALGVHGVFKRQGSREGQFAIKDAMYERFHHGDFAAVDFLRGEFIRQDIMLLSPRHHVIQTLVQWHYHRNKNCPQAAQILFPDPQAKSSTSSETYVTPDQRHRKASQSALRYLQGLWESRVDPACLMVNFRRVVAAAKLRGAKLTEEIFAVIVRYLSSVGNMATAQAVYDEMVYYHGIEASFLSKSVLLSGYARISDWDRVEHEIKALYHRGLSRSRPHGFALLVDTILKEYSARRSVEQVQNFLIKAISLWGLLPTTAVSTTVVQAYLSERRYDLIREWMETLQILFPKIETETGLFQWVLGDTWRRTQATCQDIEEALKAVAYRNPRTQLKVFSVPTIYEALSRDLASKLSAARAAIPSLSSPPTSQFSEPQSLGFNRAKTLDEYLSSAYSLIASTTSRASHPSAEVVDLHRQALSVDRVKRFISGEPSSDAVQHFVFPFRASQTWNGGGDGTVAPVMTGTLAPLSPTISHLGNDIPNILLGEFLPDSKVIAATLIEFYAGRHNNNLPTDHALFVWVCEKLLHAGRVFDAVYVLEKVYSSDLIRLLTDPEAASLPPSSLSSILSSNAQTTNLARIPEPSTTAPFSIDFFEFWMRVTWLARSVKKWKMVLEEVLRRSGVTASTTAFDLPSSTNQADTTAVAIPNHLSTSTTTTGHKMTLTISASFVFLTRYGSIKLLRHYQNHHQYDNNHHHHSGGGRSSGRSSGGRGSSSSSSRRLEKELIWYARQVMKRREEQIGRVEKWVNRSRTG